MNEYKWILNRLERNYVSGEGAGPLYDALLSILEVLVRREREFEQAADRSVGG